MADMDKSKILVSLQNLTDYDQLIKKYSDDADKVINDALTAEVTRATGVEGTLADLTTDVKTSLVAAINEVDAHADTAQGEVDALETLVGTIPASATSTTIVGYAEEVASKAAGDADQVAKDLAAYKTTNDAAVKAAQDAADDAQDDVDALETLVGTLPAGTAQTDVVSYAKALADAAEKSAADALAKAEAVQGSTTETVASVDAKVEALGTAADADVAVVEIGTSGEATDALPTVAQVKKYVTDSVADLEGATHFLGKFDKLEDVTNPVAGDIVIIGVKEYIYDKTGNWVELGDESIYVAKTTTIAGVDLENDITATEMKAALDIDDLETTVGDSTSGLVKDVADLQAAIGAGGAVADQIKAAIDDLDETVTQTAGADGLALTVVQEDGKLKSVSGSIAANTYDEYGAATTAKSEVVGTSADTSADLTLNGLSKKIDEVQGELVFATATQISDLFKTPVVTP